jgi:hypothetical protein
MRINILNLNYHLSYQLCTIPGISELKIKTEQPDENFRFHGFQGNFRRPDAEKQFALKSVYHWVFLFPAF